MNSKRIKLIPHRWAMHAIQAVAARDDVLLHRVCTEIPELPPHALDTQVETFGCGAPMQFFNHGFFDSRSGGVTGTPPFERVEKGDTLLHIAIRHRAPACAVVLVGVGVSLTIANSIGETSLDMIFCLFAAEQLQQRQLAASSGTAGSHAQASEFETLFQALRDGLTKFHANKRARVRAELEQIYAQHAPERIEKITTQMDVFEYREDELLDGVRRKYTTNLNP